MPNRRPRRSSHAARAGRNRAQSGRCLQRRRAAVNLVAVEHQLPVRSRVVHTRRQESVGRQPHRSGHWNAPVEDPNRAGEHPDPVDEVRGPIQRIDYPDDVGIGRPAVVPLLTKHAMARELAVHFLPDQVLDRMIDLGHRVVRVLSLERNLDRRVEAIHQDVATALRQRLGRVGDLVQSRFGEDGKASCIVWKGCIGHFGHSSRVPFALLPAPPQKGPVRCLT